MKTLFGLVIAAFLLIGFTPQASLAGMHDHGAMCEACEQGKACPECKDGKPCPECKNAKMCEMCKQGKTCPMCAKGKPCPACETGKSCPECAKHAKKKGMKCTRNQASTAEYIAGMERMHKAMKITYSGDVDTDFARGMVPHHQGAVDMAETVLRHGKDPEIRTLAEWIIRSQKQEIAWMNRWLERRGSPADSAKDVSATPYVVALEAANAKMHEGMDIRYSGDADYDFVRGMIPHHQGAVDMAQVLIKHGRDLEMKKLASDIILGQNREIKQMQRWLDKYPAPPLEAPKKKKHKKKHHH